MAYIQKVDVKDMAEYYTKRLLTNQFNDRVLFSCYFRQNLYLYLKRYYITFDEKDCQCVKMRLMQVGYTKKNKIYVESYAEGFLVASRLMAVYGINSHDIDICPLKDRKENQYQYIVEFTLSPEKFVEICKKCPGFVYDDYKDYNEKGERIKQVI